MKVLYLSHTSRISGAERSLLDLLAGLPADMSPVLACPDGGLATAAHAIGVRVHRLDGTGGSLRLHPWHTGRALAEMALDAIRVRRLARRLDIDVIHANSIRAGLVAALSMNRSSPPLIVHVRDCMPPSTAATLFRTVIMRRATMVIANSRYTGEAFAAGGRASSIRTIHNPVDLRRFDPFRLTRTEARMRLGLDPSAPVVGVVAQLSPWKGQDDAIRACAHVHGTYPDLRLLIVGEAIFTGSGVRFDNVAYASGLRTLARELGVAGAVDFLGHREDIPEVIRALDVLLVPSWEEPFGRTVIEAMAMEVPVIATSVGGPSEIIDDGVDGILQPPRRPLVWAEAIVRLLESDGHRVEMGCRGRATSLRFTQAEHVRQVVDAYTAVRNGRLAQSRGRRCAR